MENAREELNLPFILAMCTNDHYLHCFREPAPTPLAVEGWLLELMWNRMLGACIMVGASAHGSTSGISLFDRSECIPEAMDCCNSRRISVRVATVQSPRRFCWEFISRAFELFWWRACVTSVSIVHCTWVATRSRP